MHSVVLFALSAALLYAIKVAIDFITLASSLKDQPGYRVLFSVTGITAHFPSLGPGLSIGTSIFTGGHKEFEKFGSDVLTAVSALPSVEMCYYIGDPLLIRDIQAQRTKFQKPQVYYGALRIYGDNILTAEGESWKRFRKISAPVFTEPNSKLVWNETVHIVKDLFDNVWGNQTEITYDNALEITIPLALYVIGGAGFGRRMGWRDEMVVPPGHRMTFNDTLANVSEGLALKLGLADWLLYATPRTRRIQTAFRELEVYMKELVDSRIEAETKNGNHDLLSNLLAANDDTLEDDMRLTDQELLSNIFIYLIAGHETTSHTLGFTLALLALYQDEQERLYRELTENFPDKKTPTYNDLDKLTYTQCVLNEALRMFPAAASTPRQAMEDTVLTTKDGRGREVSIPVAAGSIFHLCYEAAHYHPQYWSEPREFRPSRFLGDWPKHAFFAFGGGMRSCIGRRFAELESLAFLSMVVLAYKVTIKPEAKYANETFEQRRERVLRKFQGVTVTPVRVPIVFTKRV